MTQSTQIVRAEFFPIDSRGQRGNPVFIHFNPASLEYTVTNSIENKGRGDNKKQYVTSTTGKLVMELIFDTTHNGQDVRVDTGKVAAFMQPTPQGNKKTPAIVLFEWGAYKFQGMVESYKETLDFFAPTGVPLRATINLTLANQDKVFEETGETGDVVGVGGSLSSVEAPTHSNPNGPGNPNNGGAGSAAAVATRAGNARAARAVAAVNNQESLRFPSGPSLTVDAAVQLGGPVAFASGGAGGGLGIGGGIGGGIGASIGAGISAGVGVSATMGGAASAGVAAGAGAFAQLHTGRSVNVAATLDTDLLLESSASLTLATDLATGFGVGGQAKVDGGIGLSADVGATVSLRDRIQFD